MRLDELKINEEDVARKYLIEKYDNVIYFGKKSLEDDINELISATNIMCGRGTFIQTLSLFMPHLQQIHYPDDGDDRMHYFIEELHSGKCIKHNEYKDYFNKVKKMVINTFIFEESFFESAANVIPL